MKEKTKQSNFDECLTKAIEDAFKQLTKPFPEAGLPGLEPLEIPSLVISAGSGPVAFEQNYQELRLSGFTKISCTQAKMDFALNKLTMQCSFPKIVMDFKYDINGKILLLPVYGKGPGTITLFDLGYDLTFSLEEYEKKGSKHYKLVEGKLKMDPKKMTFKLDNLFNGDKALGDNVLQVMNENWAEVFADVKSSYEDAFAQVASGIFGNLLAKVPAAEIFGGD
ncbi:JHBP domain containing protein [Asbolus verrucosus]|uniref:JHBP domain containing protein n=1 Tax=Asbolus verrucosus TaxID=1661398 RepID=A0A482VDJ1_ASBVE|nr:JHBP domain containing protein [Asbolus verrucosus]